MSFPYSPAALAESFLFRSRSSEVSFDLIFNLSGLLGLLALAAVDDMKCENNSVLLRRKSNLLDLSVSWRTSYSSIPFFDDPEFVPDPVELL